MYQMWRNPLGTNLKTANTSRPDALALLGKGETKMTCAMCNVKIEGGYFTTFINGIRYDFHIKCRPTFFYKEK